MPLKLRLDCTSVERPFHTRTRDFHMYLHGYREQTVAYVHKMEMWEQCLEPVRSFGIYVRLYERSKNLLH